MLWVFAMRKNGYTKIARIALMLTLSLVLSYIEQLVNLNVGVPGVKLGTANIVCLFALYRCTVGEAVGVHGGRIALSGLLFGTPVSLLYSAVGGAFSFAAMFLLKKTKLFGVVGVSVGGSVMHCVGQLCAAAILTGSSAVFAYLPFMLLWACAFGAVTGGICLAALKRIKKV